MMCSPEQGVSEVRGKELLLVEMGTIPCGGAPLQVAAWRGLVEPLDRVMAL